VAPGSYSLLDTGAKPFLHHLSTLVELYEVQVSALSTRTTST
jgi:hypothetical protein